MVPERRHAAPNAALQNPEGEAWRMTARKAG